MTARNPTDETKIAVLSQKVDDLRDDVREVKGMVGDKVATREYVDDRVNPLKKLVYWYLGLIGTLTVGLVLAVLSLVLKR
jgi:hypothetical protein